MKFNKEMKFLWVWLAVLAAVCIESLIPHASLPDGKFSLGFAARVIAFFVLAFFPVLTFPRLRNGIYAALSMALLGIVLEYLQQSVPGRHFSTQDMIANNVGVVLGFVVGLIVRMKKEMKQQVSPKTPIDRA